MIGGVYAHRLYVNGGNGYDVRAVFSIEVIEIRYMLEVVCIAFAALNDRIRNNIIGENIDLESDVLLGEYLLYLCEDLGMRCRRSGYADLLAGKCRIVDRCIIAVCGIVYRADNIAFLCFRDEVL